MSTEMYTRMGAPAMWGLVLGPWRSSDACASVETHRPGGACRLRPAGREPPPHPARAGAAVHRLALRQPVSEAVGPVLARDAAELRQRGRSGQLRGARDLPPRAREARAGRAGER